jgi:hypothetical protein
MAFIHGKSTGVFFNGTNLSSYFNEASVSQDIETAEVTAFGNSAKSYITGLKDGTMSLSGMFDGQQGAIDEVLSAALNTETAAAVTITPDGATFGKVCMSGASLETSYEISSPVGDVVSASMEVQVTGGVDRGILLAALSAVTVTGVGTAVDNAASSSNGGVAYLHVTANAHNAGSTFKVQHSADNTTFVDLVTFTTVATTATGGERIAVSGTVNRYVRASHTLAGTGSVTYSIAFSRK